MGHRLSNLTLLRNYRMIVCDGGGGGGGVIIE